MFALSTLVTFLRASRNADPRDALDLALAVDAGVVRGVAVQAAVAEVDAAGELAHHQQVGALDALALQRAGVEQRGARPHGPQVREQARAPCGGPSRPCSGRGASGSVVSHFGPPTAASSTASAPRQASRTSSVSAAAVGVDRRAAHEPLVELEVADRARAAPCAAAMISGPMPSPGSRTMRFVTAADPRYSPCRCRGERRARAPGLRGMVARRFLSDASCSIRRSSSRWSTGRTRPSRAASRRCGETWRVDPGRVRTTSAPCRTEVDRLRRQRPGAQPHLRAAARRAART